VEDWRKTRFLLPVLRSRQWHFPLVTSHATKRILHYLILRECGLTLLFRVLAVNPRFVACHWSTCL